MILSNIGSKVLSTLEKPIEKPLRKIIKSDPNRYIGVTPKQIFAKVQQDQALANPYHFELLLENFKSAFSRTVKKIRKNNP